MATAASIEASEIRRRGRRRLIGAIVLVILAVVFIPMVLDSEPRPKANDVSLEIPAKDKAPPLPAPVPPKEVASAITPASTVGAAPEKGNRAQATAGTRDAAAPKAAATVPAKPAQKTAAEKPAQKTAAEKPAPVTIAAADPKLEGFAVQIGAFKDEAKLTAAREKLMAAKIPHFVERRGDLNRLRAGPYSTREAADSALASIKAASLDGQVVPLP
jgi:DedD protein